MSSITHSTIKEWKRFLTEAGLTKELAIHYADIFSHHRMRMSMLPDLNKDILFFMGIEVMGDVIAILKHAKQVSVSLGYSKDYESSKSRSSASKQHKRERTPQYHSSSRNYSSSYERKEPQEFEPSPQPRRSNKPNQEFSSFQSFSRGHEKRSPEINITFSNSGNQKNYRGNETSDNRSSSRYEYQAQNQHYTTTPYRNRDIRSRSRSRSPMFSTRLHMDESPAKHSVRSRISSRPTKKALSPITFTTSQRTTSHASNARYYRAHTQEKKNDYPDFSGRDEGRMYADKEERQQQKSYLSNDSYVNEQMPSLTIHVDNRGKNKREILEQDSMRRPRNNSWQHDDRKSRETPRYERNQSPNKSDYNHQYTKSRHVSVFNRLT